MAHRAMNFLLKQYNPGPLLGAVKDLFSKATFYMTPINLALLAATTYNTTLRDYVAQYVPWFTFPLFMIILLFILALAMLLEFKLMIPSSITFSNIQGYKHKNPVKRDFERVLDEIEGLKKAIVGENMALKLHNNKAPRPWFIPLANEWLENYLKPDMRVFEYGSGNSTLYFAGRVSKVVSIEHDRNWYKRLGDELFRREIKNVDLLFRPPKEGKRLTSSNGEYRGMNFDSYVHSIELYYDKSFDLVVIDGRARSACIPFALKKVKPGGYILFDDTERLEYRAGLALLGRYERTDFNGKDCNCNGLTSIWRIQ